MKEQRNEDLQENIEEFFRQIVEDFKLFLEFIEPSQDDRGRLYKLKNIFNLEERSRKEILECANIVLDSNNISAAFLELMFLSILKKSDAMKLAKNVLKFENYNVVFFLLLQALREEARAKKSTKFFSDEQKSALIALMFKLGSPIRLFIDTRELLCYAKALPYNLQFVLFKFNIDQICERAMSANELFVSYTRWKGLPPNLSFILEQLVTGALQNVRLKTMKRDVFGGDGIEVEDRSDIESDPDAEPN